MATPILWENSAAHSIEYFNLRIADHGSVLEGTVILLLEGLPAHVTYRVECDAHWNTRAVVIHQQRPGDLQRLTLTVDEKRVWLTGDSSVPFATGIHDVDLEITPSTNMLPVRRTSMREGESREVDAVWIRFPGLKLERLHQIYTRVDRTRYRYENPLTGYSAMLEVDEDGLITRYGDAWRRVGA